MTTQTVLATANVLRDLGRRDAREALTGLLELEPDLVGLQEWEWTTTRLRLLRERGSVGFVPDLHLRLGSAGRGYVWSSPLLGGCAVGARAERFEFLGCRARLLSRPGRADKPNQVWGLQPPRLATVGVYRDRAVDRTVALVNYHLVAGVQSGRRYRDDRPLLVARHKGEVAALQRVIDEQLRLGRVVYAMGDSNFAGLRLDGLTSAWEGRETEPGSHGGTRQIDDVHGPGRAVALTLLTNKSDHRAVVVRREEEQ